MGIHPSNVEQEWEDSYGIWEGILGKEREKIAISCGEKTREDPTNSIKIPAKNQSQKFKIPSKIKKGKSQKFLVKINQVNSKFLLK